MIGLIYKKLMDRGIERMRKWMAKKSWIAVLLMIAIMVGLVVPASAATTTAQTIVYQGKTYKYTILQDDSGARKVSVNDGSSTSVATFNKKTSSYTVSNDKGVLLASGSTSGNGTGIALASITAPQVASSAPTSTPAVIRVDGATSQFSSGYSYLVNNVFNTTLKKYETKWQVCINICKTPGPVTIGSTLDTELNIFRTDIATMKTREIQMISTGVGFISSGAVTVLTATIATAGIGTIIAALLAIGFLAAIITVAVDWYASRVDAGFHFNRILQL